jgi:transposase
MALYAGIDLHSNNSYVGIIDDADRRLYKKKLPNDLSSILLALDRYKKDLAGVVVESTFNWYWLVDGLMEHGYQLHLANPSAIQQYKGLKYVDDKYDSFWLAHMLRLKILPEGYIYPKEERPLRDLLRKRLQLVKHRTSHILSLGSMASRNINMRMNNNYIKSLEEADIEKLFNYRHLVMSGKCSLAIVKFLDKQIKQLEKEVKLQLKIKKEFECLLRIPGIGYILAMTIMLEVGDIRRFNNKVGNYSSYCRCVKSMRLSNGKSKGKGNSKNGNKYLSWAYIEAANFAIRYCPYAKKFYQRKLAKSGKEVVAIKALSNKLSKASYYMMRDQVAYDPKKLFGY